MVLRDAVQGQNYSWALENAPIASPEFKAVLLADFNQTRDADVLTAYGPPFQDTSIR